MEERREDAEEVTLETSPEMLLLIEEESVLELEVVRAEPVARRVAELATPAVPWPAWAVIRERRVESVNRRGPVSCICVVVRFLLE